MEEADLLQLIVFQAPRPLTLRRAREMAEQLAGMDSTAATALVERWIERGYLVRDDDTASGGYRLHVGDDKPGSSARLRGSPREPTQP